MDEEEKEGAKTLFYLIETVKVLVENQKILLNRLTLLEEQFYRMDDDNERTIN
jgi:hypothetical protein